MRALLDASAIVPLFLMETRTAVMIAALSSGNLLPVVSDFAVGESAAAFSKAWRMDRLSGEALAAAFADLDKWVLSRAELVPCVAADMAHASAFVRRTDLKLRMPDALHLATARRLQVPLVAFDHRMQRAATVLAIALAAPEPR